MLPRSTSLDFEVVAVDLLHLVGLFAGDADVVLDHEIGKSVAVDEDHLGVELVPLARLAVATADHFADAAVIVVAAPAREVLDRLDLVASVLVLERAAVDEADLAPNGLAALEVRERWPQIAILVLSQYVEERYATELLANDTSSIGYLLKDRIHDLDHLVSTITASVAGRSGETARVESR